MLEILHKLVSTFTLISIYHSFISVFLFCTCTLSLYLPVIFQIRYFSFSSCLSVFCLCASSIMGCLFAISFLTRFPQSSIILILLLVYIIRIFSFPYKYWQRLLNSKVTLITVGFTYFFLLLLQFVSLSFSN